VEDQHQGNDMPKIDRFKGKYEFLSNFYPVKILADGAFYPSVEHAFVAMKTEDKDIRKQISELPTAADAKKFGRKIKIREDWDDIKVAVMLNLLIKKFQHDDLKKRLKNTEGYELIEGNFWHDCYWGNCSCEKCKNIEGQNVLGRLLMKVRTAICAIK